MNKRIGRILQFVAIALLVVMAVVLINQYGMATLRAQVERMGVWAPVGLFVLRFSSVVIPALPGTAYSIAAGGLLGFQQGLFVVCLSDLLSCSLSFWLSRRYGRSLVSRLVGKRFMDRVDRLSQRHLEQNFFLMTAFLMSGFFDFVAYGVGLAKAPWKKFFPALVLSIAISNPPIVAVGASALEGGKILLFLALLGVFGLALIAGWVRRHEKPVEIEQR
ncbi:SNARE associated Golgi protein [Synechococcus sp. PCC 7335]|uniref:TVP38/TMEM64 family protein n=1 Tax=Synechococcus sp. (strain ATCC 29403 / PCC 7335) TaxID=91464 RepID=UPI00017EE08E|nr:VTT domain-containing protein [Synechococcus sp. PCC 7335]EDX86764.1 SNARE associated Golgi protein [Synechococcus sp. PCC 7335]